MSGPINSALSAMVGRANFPQMHHPHALVAHYDLATVLRALQRRGDMTYPGQLTGATVVRIAIDSPGGLATLRLLNAAGSDELNRTAEQIVRQTAPVSLFPAELGKQTSPLKLITNRCFEGIKDLVPESSSAALAGAVHRGCRSC